MISLCFLNAYRKPDLAEQRDPTQQSEWRHRFVIQSAQKQAITLNGLRKS